MNWRYYNHEKDLEQARRVYKEVGWITDKKQEEAQAQALNINGTTIVSEMNDSIECVVTCTRGDMVYLDELLSLEVVLGVTTSLVARRQGLASGLTATALALAGENGADLAALGIFDEGYYDRLGFGIMNYKHYYTFSPSTLNLRKTKIRPPVRLFFDNWEEMAIARSKRMRLHGSVNLKNEITRMEMSWCTKGGFGLGYRNDEGELTHYFWGNGYGSETAPLDIYWIVYQNYEQFYELLQLIKALDDQYKIASMAEPPGIIFQSFIKRPFLMQSMTKGSSKRQYNFAKAWKQYRIMNLESCIEKTHLNCDEISFNLKLDDPVTKYIPEDMAWQGIGGEYVVTLGNHSSIKKGNNYQYETLECSVGAFTKMWMGVQKASALTLYGDFKAEKSLLDKLDKAICLPMPNDDFEF